MTRALAILLACILVALGAEGLSRAYVDLPRMPWSER